MMLFVLLSVVAFVQAANPTKSPVSPPTNVPTDRPTSSPNFLRTYTVTSALTYSTTTKPTALCESPCPTSCPNGYVPGTEWVNPNTPGCTVYCMDQPTNDQCEAGGFGCTSSCIGVTSSSHSSTTSLSPGAVAGIAIGGVVLLFLVLYAAHYFGVGCFAFKNPFASVPHHDHQESFLRNIS